MRTPSPSFFPALSPLFLAALLAPVACTSSSGVDAGPADSGLPDSGPPPVLDGGLSHPCRLPGAWVNDASGPHAIPGGTGPSLAWLHLPVGFCAHHYANVPYARQLRFAPGGELFVASPVTKTTSNSSGDGMAAIAVVPDDNADGLGDTVLSYKSNLPNTQGLMFGNGKIYWQDGSQVRSEPYARGQRSEPANAVTELEADISLSAPQDPYPHWPKSLDISDTGKIYVSNGGSQGDQCQSPMPFIGGILQIDGSQGGAKVAMGFRNPINVKCHHDGRDICYATELAKDFSDVDGDHGREKLVPIRQGDNWGFPCCATANTPYSGSTADCSQIAPESDSFLIGDTPFGFDFEDALWASPWDHKVVVALHGSYNGWQGARVVAIALDPNTGMPLPGTTADGGGSTGNMVDFVTGWDDGTQSHGRPTDATFSPDGRLFISDDQLGEIFWIAAVH